MNRIDNVFKLKFSFLEYDDSDGNQQHDHEYDFNSSAQHNSQSNKRSHDDEHPANEDDAYEQDQDQQNNSLPNINDGESSTGNTEAQPKKKRRKEFLNLNATFMAGVQGVVLVTEQVNYFLIAFSRQRHNFKFYYLVSSHFWVIYKKQYRKCADLSAAVSQAVNRFQWI